VVLNKKRWLNLMLSVILCIAMLPTYPVQAATQYFTFPSAGTTPDEALRNPINTQVISQFYGTFSQAVPATLSYSVQQIVQDGSGAWVAKGTPNSIPNATPLISGPTSQEFHLLNVNLFDGMNKITVTTQTGVEGIAYVYFDNATFISSITLNSGVTLNSSAPVYVDSGTQFFIIKAPNASSVSVNGVNATYYGPASFSVSNFVLHPGPNKLVFTAKSDTRQYSVTREIIYLNGPGSVFNVFLQSNATNSANDAVQIDTGVVVSSSTALPRGLKGQIAFPTSSGVNPNLVFSNVDLLGTSIPINNPDSRLTLTGPVSDGQGHEIYDFFFDLSGETATGWPISTNGTYQIVLQGTYFNGTATQSFSTPIAFNFKDSSKASIANVQQVFGVDPITDTGGTPGYFSTSITDLPIYALISAQNNAGDFTPEISVKQNNNTVNLVSGVDYVVVGSDTTSGKGWKKVKILKLPFTGDMTITFSINDGGAIDTYPPISFNYNPIPSIVVYGIYNGDNYSSTTLPDFSGKLFNFITNAEKQNIIVTVNGVVKHAQVDVNNSTFKVVNGDPAASNQLTDVLSEGPNEVKITGTAQGVPVVTRLTVYYYSSDAPVIENPFPVPVPTVASATRNLTDPMNKFVIDPASSTTYNTTEKTADVLIGVSNAEQMIVMKDGKQFFTIAFDSTGNPTTGLPITIHENGNVIRIESEPALPGYFRISDLPLTLGSTSLVVKAIKGPISSFTPLTIVRSEMPYQVLSPKLPEERVVNQNFLNVQIAAEGADSVLLGKTEMKRVTEGNNEYFIGTVDNLKKGSNKIKYTVVKGKKKSNQEFEVVYANTNTIGAQFASTLSKSGKIEAFNKAFSLTFPKGTMLTPANKTSAKIELFDKQKLMIGIADPADGRTVRTYNHFGNIMTINPSFGFLQAALTLPEHFGYASHLFWVDAGFNDVSSPTYAQLDGMHPYYGEEMNYTDPLRPYSRYNVSNRQMDNTWMKTTQRGTLTLQYDSTIRDFAANRVSIWRFGLDGATMKWTNIGGKVNTKNHTISTPIDSFGYYAVFLNTYGFDDSQSHDFARDEMELLYARGIMNSKNNGEFGAYEPTTRGEFATILVKALNIPLEYDESNVLFFDVPHSLYASPYWDYRYIETAGQKGFARGIGTRQFAPDDPVSREQAAIMIAYALNLKLSTDLDKTKANLDKVFEDSGKIKTYSRTAVEAVYKAKLMSGRTKANPDDKGKPFIVFDPQDNITRGETAKVIVNMMRSKKLL